MSWNMLNLAADLRKIFCGSDVVSVTSLPPGVLPLPTEPGRGDFWCRPGQRICTDSLWHVHLAEVSGTVQPSDPRRRPVTCSWYRLCCSCAAQDLPAGDGADQAPRGEACEARPSERAGRRSGNSSAHPQWASAAQPHTETHVLPVRLHRGWERSQRLHSSASRWYFKRGMGKSQSTAWNTQRDGVK